MGLIDPTSHDFFGLLEYALSRYHSRPVFQATAAIMVDIGPYSLRNNLFLAPMVGVSDAPFRELCSDLGAGLTVAEMLTCNSELWQSEKNRLKQVKAQADGPHVVQIAGSDPVLMAIAARLNVDQGADAIDINMGCPAKKVLKKAAGSALLKDPRLVADILTQVVKAVPVPVTLKIRTGWCPQTRNGVDIARIAQDCGIQLLSVHGRTRECRFKGAVEYDTIAEIKRCVDIPVIANGDIDSPESAKKVLDYTGADGIMIGRAAQGRPWLFSEIEQYLKTGRNDHRTSRLEQQRIVRTHLEKMTRFYGEFKSVWYARKHVGSYVKSWPGSRELLSEFNRLDSTSAQLDKLSSYFYELNQSANQYAEGQNRAA